MGKAKRRGFRPELAESLRLSRTDAINEVLRLVQQSDAKKEAYELITLFGLSAEELLEAGAPYETVMSLRGIVKE